MRAGETPADTYASDVDGLAVAYPTTWQRAETPLAARLAGEQVEILGLATGRLPDAERGCSPYPWAAMRALEAGDLVLTLRVSQDPVPEGWTDYDGQRPLASKPDTLLDQPSTPPDELPGGCAVDDVQQRTVDFLAHGRWYTAFLASRGDLDEQRRDELQSVWSSLTLRPVRTADELATVGERYWHVLYTHCGIVQTQFAGRDWIADPILDDGNRNPPLAWGNPTQPGTMGLTAPDRARFESRDQQLHATFRPRTPTDPPTPPCA
jgi:hypothetical protein